MKFPAEAEFRERVRDAIQRGGKVSAMSHKTGIAVGTLNKYVAKTSTPSVENALKIAVALGITVEQLVRGELEPSVLTMSTNVDTQKIAPGFKSERREGAHSPVSIENPTLPLRRRVMRDVKAAYRTSGLTASEEDISVAAMEVFASLTDRVLDIDDEKEVDLVLAQLLHNLDRELRKTALSPGSGKRSAS